MVRRLLRDPLTHFAVLGVTLFGLFVALGRDAGDELSILVSQDQQRQLTAAFMRTWRRVPTAEELKGLIDDHVREELANREARRLGLLEGDPVIRRRLRQKYESVMEHYDAAVTPTDTQLQGWYDSHQSDYRQPARYSLQQIFFSADRRDDPRADAMQALDGLRGEAADSARVTGDAVALPRRFADARQAQIGARLGTEFAQALAQLPRGRWSGPLPSAYGQHLVFIETATPPRTPPLEAVRERVLRDWRSEQLRRAREARYGDLLQRYRVVIEAAANAGIPPPESPPAGQRADAD